MNELQTYQTLSRHFKSEDNGVPQPIMSARFVNANKKTLEIKDSDKIPLQDDQWTKELEVAEIDVLQVIRTWQSLHDSKRVPELLVSADGARSSISGGSSWEIMSVRDPVHWPNLVYKVYTE